MKKTYISLQITPFLVKRCKMLENIQILLYVKKIQNYLIKELNQIMFKELMN